ncbi:hypothetical protein PF008_g28153 [Phytophthora fragariae]|uniref:Uncharacterized protein n=1 Tax=Phytophthora fragariae TaxID=53985 RepID=A0A6G0QCU1_9STRA|nr:hypothetical protein PF008_g28153 [Phytophthora fragariae]
MPSLRFMSLSDTASTFKGSSATFPSELSVEPPRIIMLAQLVADVCPSSASFFGFMGVASALVFASTLPPCWP